MNAAAALPGSNRLTRRGSHGRGAAIVALGLGSGVAVFVFLLVWASRPGAAWWEQPAFGPPATLARGAAPGGAPGLAMGARESLVLRSDNRGQVLFGRYCDSCHPGGQEGIGPSLRSTQFKRTATSPDKIVATVRKGGFEMPAFSPGMLGDADLADIAQYVLSLPEAPR